MSRNTALSRKGKSPQLGWHRSTRAPFSSIFRKLKISAWAQAFPEVAHPQRNVTLILWQVVLPPVPTIMASTQLTAPPHRHSLSITSPTFIRISIYWLCTFLISTVAAPGTQISCLDSPHDVPNYQLGFVGALVSKRDRCWVICHTLFYVLVS